MTDSERERPGSEERAGVAAGGVRPSVLALVVIAAAVLAFAPALGGPFLFDDRPLIANNAFVHGFAHWKRWFVTDFWNLGEDFLRTSARIVYYRPLVTATYAFEWRLGGGAPTLFHAVNLLLHGLVAWLSFRALRRWTDTLLPAFVAALLFAVHPTKAESVAWIAGRTDVLCMVALLVVAEGVALRLRAEPGSMARGLALEVLGTVLAYGTKEQAITLPAIVAVEAWVVAGRPSLDRATIVRCVRAALPQLGLALVYLALRQRLLPVRQKMFTVSLGDWAAMMFETWGRYFELTFFPHDLSVQQGLVRAENNKLLVSMPHVVVGVLGLTALIAVMVAFARRRPAVSVGVAFYLAMLLPTSNVVPTGMVTLLSERFLYAPTLGLALVVATLLGALPDGRRRVALSLASLSVVLLTVVAARRSADFDDEPTFWQREARLHPESMEAVRFLKGQAMVERRYKDALVAAAALHQTCARWYAHTGYEADALVESIEVLALLAPDGDAPALTAYAAFLGQTLDHTPTPTLDRPGLRITLARRAPVQRRIEALEHRILGLRASILSRLGKDAAAIAVSQVATSHCTRCGSVWRDASLVHARAGDFATATRFLDEAARLEGEPAVKLLRTSLNSAALDAQQAALAEGDMMKALLGARSLARLEAWGRAYALLAPHRALLEKAPGLALTYAELAYRSGDEKGARAMLAVVRPPETIDPTVKDWARKMGW
ncbi:MAG: hypothetical protein JNL79_17620 [Myxococcales bacterium]|nr:hypothetical protein [Myxococcales bacterium]